jgi:hypothetical protein
MHHDDHTRTVQALEAGDAALAGGFEITLLEQRLERRGDKQNPQDRPKEIANTMQV